MRDRFGRRGALSLEATGTGRMFESGSRTTVARPQRAADLRATC
jgi:hypothetical protein